MQRFFCFCVYLDTKQFYCMKKTYWLIIGFFIFMFCFAFSCNENDSYSLGDFRIAIATVVSEGENPYSLLLDNGQRLWPAATDVQYAPKYNQRVFVNYTILSGKQNGYDHYVKINDVWNILTKKTMELNAHNADSIGDDPVKINAAWVGNDFLNIDFMFNYGGKQAHAINLVHNTLSSFATPDAIDLELRHNAYGSTQSNLYEGFVCFDLKPLKVQNADSVKIAIHVKDWDGGKTYNVVYRYNQAALQNSTMETPIPVISSNEYF